MRVGIVAEYYRPWPGGVSEHVHHQAVELTRRGHDVTVLTGPGKPGFRDDALRVVRLGFSYEFTSNGALSRLVLGPYLLRFRALLRRHAFDVLHVHAPMDPLLPMGAVYAAECPVVGTFHASFEPGPLWDFLYRGLRPLTHPAWDRLAARVAVSPEARRSIGRYFDGVVEIVPNGVDTERFHPGAAPLPALDDARPRILFVGRADPRKGLPILLDAFVRVRERRPDAELVVVGVREDEIAPQLAALDAPTRAAVRCQGYVCPEDMPRYYTSCDVFCSPATGQESQGIVLLEAMAAGRAPVAFAIPGYRDVVSDGVDGWLVDEVGAAPLADALLRALGDRTALQRVGEAGRKAALAYSWPSVIERIEGEYRRVVERSAPRRHGYAAAGREPLAEASGPARSGGSGTERP